MSGRAGRSGGANKIPSAVHLARGTFRPVRHGSPALAAVEPASRPVAVNPPDWLLEGLGEAGRAFLADLFGEYELTPLELRLAKLAGETIDDIDAARRAADLKSQRSDVRRLIAILTRLGLPDLRRDARGAE